MRVAQNFLHRSKRNNSLKPRERLRRCELSPKLLRQWRTLAECRPVRKIERPEMPAIWLRFFLTLLEEFPGEILFFQLPPRPSGRNSAARCEAHHLPCQHTLCSTCVISTYNALSLLPVLRRAGKMYLAATSCFFPGVWSSGIPGREGTAQYITKRVNGSGRIRRAEAISNSWT